MRLSVTVSGSSGVGVGSSILPFIIIVADDRVFLGNPRRIYVVAKPDATASGEIRVTINPLVIDRLITTVRCISDSTLDHVISRVTRYLFGDYGGPSRPCLGERCRITSSPYGGYDAGAVGIRMKNPPASGNHTVIRCEDGGNRGMVISGTAFTPIRTERGGASSNLRDVITGFNGSLAVVSDRQRDDLRGHAVSDVKIERTSLTVPVMVLGSLYLRESMLSIFFTLDRKRGIDYSFEYLFKTLATRYVGFFSAPIDNHHP